MRYVKRKTMSDRVNSHCLIINLNLIIAMKCYENSFIWINKKDSL
ncbi:hypothetical protein A1OE_1221 [Candidatus Endolissoclinum faulkneri L2]|uniref:Uncharacterized protein n=1 Tax=Candidatus Endolissoclinum faulkneri L2 TaxID=1193729 RepID=K7ZDC2_9PROT|nr:hypothetical protein A1OE_1221 [Candidatus Endolissoclinum faulkneri L2]